MTPLCKWPIKMPFTNQALSSLLFHMQNISCGGSGKFLESFWVLKWHSSLDFDFLPSLLSSSFAFLASFIAGKSFWESFSSILGLNERKRLMGSETRFSWKFLGQHYMAFCFFLWPPWLNRACSCMVWKISFPFTWRTIKLDLDPHALGRSEPKS